MAVTASPESEAGPEADPTTERDSTGPKVGESPAQWQQRIGTELPMDTEPAPAESVGHYRKLARLGGAASDSGIDSGHEPTVDDRYQPGVDYQADSGEYSSRTMPPPPASERYGDKADEFATTEGLAQNFATEQRAEAKSELESINRSVESAKGDVKAAEADRDPSPLVDHDRLVARARERLSRAEAVHSDADATMEANKAEARKQVDQAKVRVTREYELVGSKLRQAADRPEAIVSVELLPDRFSRLELAKATERLAGKTDQPFEVKTEKIDGRKVTRMAYHTGSDFVAVERWDPSNGDLLALDFLKIGAGVRQGANPETSTNPLTALRANVREMTGRPARAEKLHQRMLDILPPLGKEAAPVGQAPQPEQPSVNEAPSGGAGYSLAGSFEALGYSEADARHLARRRRPVRGFLANLFNL